MILKYFLIAIHICFSIYSNAQEDITFNDDTTRSENGYYNSFYRAIRNADDVKTLNIGRESIKNLLCTIDTFPNLNRLNLFFAPKDLKDSSYINISKSNTLTSLHISHSDITVLPFEIALMPNLKTLDISNCDLFTFEGEFFRHTNIETALFEKNLLVNFPQIYSDTNKVKVLSMKSNRISRLPNDFYKLQKLKFLNIANNRFELFPKEILKLKELEVLNIGFNDIETIPDEISELDNLVTLYITKTKVKSLPISMKNMKNLKSVFISPNYLNKKEKSKIIESLPPTCIIDWTNEDYYHNYEVMVD